MENIKIIKLENGDDIVCSFLNEQLLESRIIRIMITNKVYSTINWWF